MFTTGAAASVTHDLLMRWNTQTQLQVDATRIAIAGAVFLPGAPARAMKAAAHSASLCGIDRLEVVQSEAASDRMSFEVTLRRTVPLQVLWLLGMSAVSASAIATVHPMAPRRQADSTIVLSALPATPLDSTDVAS
jgi:hypothetical protein